MTDSPADSGQANFSDSSAGEAAGQPPFGAAAPGSAAYPGAPGQPGRPQTSDAKGFLAALFDFGFTSFVTPKIIKVLYFLIVVLAALGTLAYAVFAFGVNVGFGIVVLFVVAPLIFLITTALYRICLEMFMIVFRIAEDVRAIRENGGSR